MVQNKEKLREVGLEPDKPVGQVRAIWAITLILAFTLIVGGGVYFILWYSPWSESTYWSRQEKSEIKDWQTYTDQTNEVGFKYPKDWQYRDYGKIGVLFYQQENEVTIRDFKWEGLTLLPVGIGYHVETGTLLNTLAKFETEHGSCTAQDKKIAGKGGKLVECPPVQGMTKTVWYYLVENEGKTFYLFTVDEGDKSILEKMVGTVSFTEASNTPTASNSTTKYDAYNNSSLAKFSFEYPNNLYVLPEFQEYSGIVKILKKGSDNVLVPTKIEIKVNYLGSKTTDLRAAYKEINQADIPESGNSSVTEATVAGKAALKQTYTDVGDIGYFFINGDYFYEISAWTNRMLDDTSPLSDSTTKAAFEHLVSSFKF